MGAAMTTFFIPGVGPLDTAAETIYSRLGERSAFAAGIAPTPRRPSAQPASGQHPGPSVIPTGQRNQHYPTDAVGGEEGGPGFGAARLSPAPSSLAKMSLSSPGR